MAKHILRKQLTKHHINELPHLIENVIGPNNDWTALSVKREEKANNKGQGRKGESTGKIYKHIAKDIRDLVDKKTQASGGYVMPRLVNLNLDCTASQSGLSPGLKPKGIVFHY